MLCSHCGGENPKGARFCMFCAASIPDTDERGAVTGPTRRLDPPSPQPNVPRVPSTPVASHRRWHGKRDIGGPLFLIGLGLLFATKTFWPGIFVLLGVMALVSALQHGRGDGMQGLFFFGGLALLFATGWWWPGVLLWIGATSWFGSRRGGGRCGW